MQSSPDVQGFALPDVVDPPDSICFQVNVPNDPGHLKAFLGVLYDLTLWVSWQRDASHKGIQAAQVWKKIWTDLENGGCEVITFQQPDDCTLQVSYDDGVTWTTIYNGLDCAISAADGEITKFLADGILGGPTQPGPTPAPDPGQCWNYHVILQANAPWKIPIALNDGYTITTSNLSGATFDGAFTPFWYCGDGGWFLLGECGGSPHTETGDPLPTANHMSLIVGVAAVFAPMADNVYTVPGGTGAVDGVFQVNDGALGDNGGTLEFDVEVCTTGWVHVFNFLDNDGSWVTQGTDSWVAGVGWTMDAADGGIYIDISPAATINYYQVKYSTTGFSSPGFNQARLGDGHFAAISPCFVAGGSSALWTGSESTTEVNVRLYDDPAHPTGATGTVTVTEITLKGNTGADPF